MNIGNSTSNIATNNINTSALTVVNKNIKNVSSNITSNLTLTFPLNDCYFITASGNLTLTLPTPATANTGASVIFYKQNTSNTITLSTSALIYPYGSSTGATTATFTGTTSTVQLYTNGTNWYISNFDINKISGLNLTMNNLNCNSIIATGTLSSGAITSSGAISCGNNALSCGVLSASSLCSNNIIVSGINLNTYTGGTAYQLKLANYAGSGCYKVVIDCSFTGTYRLEPYLMCSFECFISSASNDPPYIFNLGYYSSSSYNWTLTATNTGLNPYVLISCYQAFSANTNYTIFATKIY